MSPRATPAWPAHHPRLAPSRLPLTIVCGPPAAGKTTYVRARAAPGDVVVDLDEICLRLFGGPMYSWNHRMDRSYLGPALEERDRMLGDLACDQRERVAAWFVVGAPEHEERERWRALAPERMAMILTPPAECKRRVRADERRADLWEHFDAAIDDWWRRWRRNPREALEYVSPGVLR